MRTIRALSAALLTLGLAAAPAAADPWPSASRDGGAAPRQAGTSFRTATEIEQGQRATASGSTGDYLYWSFPADTGQRPTVRATVKLPDTHAAQTWQIDVYDGLRRRQACQYGAQTRAAAADTPSVELACVLRTVRAWSEPWANDPLPGTYYIRLTATGVPTSDLGLPVTQRSGPTPGTSAARRRWTAHWPSRWCRASRRSPRTSRRTRRYWRDSSPGRLGVRPVVGPVGVDGDGRRAGRAGGCRRVRADARRGTAGAGAAERLT
ncbi:hypothetical protein SAFG77S_03483 [Streptomyces afghaniensis]